MAQRLSYNIGFLITAMPLESKDKVKQTYNQFMLVKQTPCSFFILITNIA